MAVRPSKSVTFNGAEPENPPCHTQALCARLRQEWGGARLSTPLHRNPYLSREQRPGNEPKAPIEQAKLIATMLINAAAAVYCLAASQQHPKPAGQPVCWPLHTRDKIRHICIEKDSSARVRPRLPLG